MRALEFQCVGRWNGAADAIFISLHGRLKLANPDTVLSEPVMLDRIQWPDSSNPLLKRDRDVSVLFTISAPLSPAVISFIEDQRKGGDVGLRLDILYQWQEGRKQPNSPGPVLPLGPVYCSQASAIQTVAHSEWLKLLNELQWAEYELFEVASLVLKDDVKRLPNGGWRLFDPAAALRAIDLNTVCADEGDNPGAKQQAVLTLLREGRKSHQQVAPLLGISEEAARKRLERMAKSGLVRKNPDGTFEAAG
jgi:hypothetical protein